jgi:transposase-like protein
MDIFRLSDEEAYDLFKQARWADNEGEPVCPVCGGAHHYHIKTRKQWRCKACNHTFSVTSGTLFAHHKMPLRIYLAAIALYSNTAKGFSALQLSRDLNVQYKTAYVLMHKIRESLQDNEQEQLSGTVEIDGAYFNGHVRPENEKADRKDRRLAENQNPNKRCVMVMRERGEKGEGARKTKTFVVKSENQADIRKLVTTNVANDSTINADECTAYDVLHAQFQTNRINHQERYSDKNGTSTNLAESYFARLRRMHLGQMHRMSKQHLDSYANECAYREDTRRWSNGEIFADITSRCAIKKTSRNWCGYWQNNKKEEKLAA